MEFIDLHTKKELFSNKLRKDIEKSIQQIHDNYKSIENDKLNYEKISHKENEISLLQKQLESIQYYIHSDINIVLNLLEEKGKTLEDFKINTL